MITLSGTLHISSQGTLLHCSLGRFVLNDGRFMDRQFFLRFKLRVYYR